MRCASCKGIDETTLLPIYAGRNRRITLARPKTTRMRCLDCGEEFPGLLFPAHYRPLDDVQEVLEREDIAG